MITSVATTWLALLGKSAARTGPLLAGHVLRAVAEHHGAGVRAVQLRKTDLGTGRVEQVFVPCGLRTVLAELSKMTIKMASDLGILGWSG